VRVLRVERVEAVDSELDIVCQKLIAPVQSASVPRIARSPYNAAPVVSRARKLAQRRKEPAPWRKKESFGREVDEVRERIAAACAKAKRDTTEVTLVAVTKTAAPEQIREILQARRRRPGREPRAGASAARPRR
jgi:hypothetical protein